MSPQHPNPPRLLARRPPRLGLRTPLGHDPIFAVDPGDGPGEPRAALNESRNANRPAGAVQGADHVGSKRYCISISDSVL